MQTKRQSFVESLANIGIGMGISLIVQIVLYPIMNIEVRFSQNIIITVVFTIVSIARSYFVRRFFNKKHKSK